MGNSTSAAKTKKEMRQYQQQSKQDDGNRRRNGEPFQLRVHLQPQLNICRNWFSSGALPEPEADPW